MTSLTLTPAAESVIERYLHFRIGPAECSVPYFNNRTIRARGALAARVGKGSPQEIREEAEMLLFKHHVSIPDLTGEKLKEFLVEHSLGIDCSGFAYHVLDAESRARGKSGLAKSMTVERTGGLFRKLVNGFNISKSVDVAAFTDPTNSEEIGLGSARAGDIVCMIGGPDQGDRDHILVIREVVLAGAGAAASASTPKFIRYSHAVSYPNDGVYGSGIKEGEIEAIKPEGSLADQLWRESGSVQGAAAIFARVSSSQASLRRLKAFN